jgi:hypothetical protein
VLTPLDRCLAEQRACAEYDGPDQFGAMLGWSDWGVERLLIAEEIEEYQRFRRTKLQEGSRSGFKPLWLPSSLFDFQRSVAEWNIETGKSADFIECGLGKSWIELVWAENVVRHTNKPVLLLDMLGVTKQMIGEAKKVGVEAKRTIGQIGRPAIYVTNYEKLHHFSSHDFGGVVCDESSAIKAMNGKRREQVTEFLRTIPYRLMATATPAPNDFIELGTTSEALGVMGQIDMLNRFFKNDQNTSDTRTMKRRPINQGGPVSAGWRFKGHAEEAYWRWVPSWARAGRKPSDFGPFDDSRFALPRLIEREHVVTTRTLAPGMLFPTAATNRQEELEERRRTITERCEKAAELVAERGNDLSIIWCQLNDEGDLLERVTPNCLQISGSHDDDYKETVLDWFLGNRCICDDTRFGAKLATWRRERRDTGNDIIENTACSVLRNLSVGGEPIASGESTTWPNTTETIQESGGASECVSNDVNTKTTATPPIQSTGRNRLKRSVSTINEIQTPNSQDGFASLDSLSSNIIGPSNAAAPYAGPLATRTPYGDDLLSTIVTQPASSGGSSAPRVILVSENSGMIPSYYYAPRCICGHRSGKRVLVSKAKIFGWGLNLQCCNHVVTFADHSFEQHYQSVRRCWRFGQVRPVTVDIIATEGQSGIKANLHRKMLQAERMFERLVANMQAGRAVSTDYAFNATEVIPSWL